MSTAPDPRAKTVLEQARVKGEPFVWLTGMGLVVAFIMAAVLLGVIVTNGLAVFWPERITEYTLKDGDKTTVLAGTSLKTVERYSGELGKAPELDLHLFIGNKDVYGNGFRYVKTTEIISKATPPALMSIERQEYGNAVGYPVELRLKDTQTKQVTKIPAEDARFEVELQRLIAAANERWDDIRYIEKGKIGDNATLIANLEIKRKKATGAEAEAIAKTIAERKAEFTVLQKESGALRAMQIKDKLAIRLATGEIREIQLGKIVSVHWPNRMGFLSRVGYFFERMWLFMTENPREVNTEGGIFPAIFGTFVMTIMMSVGVVPIGVLAAVYLREYAKQGPFVRMVRIAVNNLAGVPSIVFGVFGLGFFVYFVGGGLDKTFFADYLPSPTFGTGGIFWAAATLALMTVPVVIVATEESIAAVPRGMKEASLALGASKWQTIQQIVLPASIPGILTGTILAMARGAGEVAPLMLVGVVKLAPSLPLNTDFPYVHLDQKFMHLGFHIYDLAFQSPDSEAARPAVFATTLFLILLVLILNLTAILMRERLRRKFKSSAF